MIGHKPWKLGSPVGRWSGFGPYYAMFPVEFAKRVVQRFSPSGGFVLDPFCGRGTVPYVSAATRRKAVGFDINAVAWVYGKTKLDPEPCVESLLTRLYSIRCLVRAEDSKPQNQFQGLAWTSEVLAFLNCARRELNWRGSRTDRTLMAFILVYLHGKQGQALSNQMRQSKAMAPDYSVNWWKDKGSSAPQICPVKFLSERIVWRYKPGLPKLEKAHIYLGQSEFHLRKYKNKFESADLLLTSPPYCGVTNYKYDNWIRYWMLGEEPLPDSGNEFRYSNRGKYHSMLMRVIERSKDWCKEDAVVYVRTDARSYTLQTTVEILETCWPEHRQYAVHAPFLKATQTALFGDHAQKPGEVDLLFAPPGVSIPRGFRKISKRLITEIAA